MSLENSKRYGLPSLQQSLLEKSKERLAAVLPHQAPQRERASARTASPSAAAARLRRRTTSARNWKGATQPDVNMGVPQLLMILEPNVVWEHTKDYVGSLEQAVQATCCSSNFFEGNSQQGRMAHGVYEGSYWQLLGDLVELEGALEKLAARVPEERQEPELQLPQPPVLPQWEAYKPVPLPAPEPPSSDAAVMPHFRPPRLPTEVPWQQPPLLPVPPLPPPLKDTVPPTYQPPQEPVIEPFVEPQLLVPEAPVLPEKPQEPHFGAPQHGHDWSGERPFTVPEPVYEPPQLPPEPTAALPAVPAPQLQEAQLDLRPAPVVQLTWFQSPEDAAAAAEEAAAAAADADDTVSASISAVASVAGSAYRRSTSSRPSSAARAAAVVTAELDTAIRRMSREEVRQQWQEVQGAEAGQPQLWLDFTAPFAEPPPVALPPRPVPGPEPVYEAPWDLQELPVFVEPEPQPLPEFQELEFVAPCWAAPTEPRPVGFLRGAGPVLIMDVSGTMHPARMGQFNRMKACVAQLLAPDGEMATAAQDFDVITFASSAWSWSAAYETKCAMLRTLHTPHQGRQAGSRPSSAVNGRPAKLSKPSPGLQSLTTTARPTSAQPLEDQQPQASVRPSLRLQPADAEHLSAAQAWVEGWPEAVGHTALWAALSLAHVHGGSADSWYLFSDGLADDSAACLEWVEQLLRAGSPVPPVHTVGFFPRNARDGVGERFLRQLSELTGGTFQVYDGDFLGPNMAKMFGEGGVVPYDLTAELPSERSERLWAEEQLKLERRQALRDGHVEHIQTVLGRLQQRHHEQRVLPALAQHERRVALLRYQHEAMCAAVRKANDKAGRRAAKEHAKLVQKVTTANASKVAAAEARHKAAIAKWHADQNAALAAWQKTCADIQAAAAAAAQAQQQRHHQQLASAVAAQQSSALSMDVMSAAKLDASTSAEGAQQQAAVPAASGPPAAARLAGCDGISAVEHPAVPQPSRAPPQPDMHRRRSSSGSSDSTEPVDTVRDMGSAKIKSLPLDRVTSLASMCGWGGTPRLPDAQGADAAATTGAAGAATAAVVQRRATASPTPTGGPGGNVRRLRSSTSPAPGANARPLNRAVSARASSSTSDNAANIKRPASGAEGPGARSGSRPSSVLCTAPQGSNSSSGGSNSRPGTAAGKQSKADSRPGSATGNRSSRPRSGNKDRSKAMTTSILDDAEEAELGALDGCEPADLDSQAMADDDGSNDGRDAPPTNSWQPAPGSMAASKRARFQFDSSSEAGAGINQEVSGPLHPVAATLQADAAAARPGTPQYIAQAMQLVEQRNREALQRAEQGWAETVQSTEQHNTAQLQKAASHQARREAMLQAGLSAKEAWLREKGDMVAAAEEAHRAACARAAQQNAGMAAAHAKEVAAKRTAEAAYAKAVVEHASAMERLTQMHDAQVAAAQAEHAARLQQERQEWEARKQQLLEEHAGQLQRTQEEHTALVQQIKEANRRAREEHTVQSAAHREATIENRRRLAEAQTAHQAANAALVVENQRAMEAARLAHEQAYAQAQLDAVAAAAKAEADHAAACASIEQQNTAALEAARSAYQAAIERLITEHESVCAALRAQHAAQVAAVCAYNAEIAPQLVQGKLVLSELARVRIFAAHMRACAAKLQLGVNFMKNTPNLDRVVEMDALTEGLQKAFPEFEPRQYPWPHMAQAATATDNARAAATAGGCTAGDDASIGAGIGPFSEQQAALQGSLGTWRANPKQPIQLSHYEDPSLAVTRLLAAKHLAAARPQTAPARARPSAATAMAASNTWSLTTWQRHTCSDDAFHATGSTDVGPGRHTWQDTALSQGRPQTAPAKGMRTGHAGQQQQQQQQKGSGSWEAAGYHALMRPVSAKGRHKQHAQRPTTAGPRLGRTGSSGWHTTVPCASDYEAELRAVYLGRSAASPARQRPQSAPRSAGSQYKPARHSVDAEWMLRCFARQ